ncbi:MAG: retroviral-like aspartic protease family protein [Cyanobacteria bacterium REEB67]|nr:retroviral-like aspartic protease family protein [Cyanobacteria bacterium REEB67]
MKLTLTSIYLASVCSIAPIFWQEAVAAPAKPAAAPAAATDKRSLGIAAYNNKDYRGAAQLLDDYLVVNSRDPYAAYYAAICQQQLGNSAKSRLLYRQVYQLAPTSQIGSYSKAILLKLDPTFAAGIAAADAASAGAGAKKNDAVTAKSPEDIARAIVKNSHPAVDDSEILDRSMPAQCRIPFTPYSHGGAMLDGYINNRPVKLLFDTGAPGVCVGKNHLKEWGISEPTGAPAGTTGGSSSGDPVAFWVMKATVKVGNIEKRDMPIEILEYDHSPPLLGQTFFSKYVYTIDTKACQINLKQKAIANQETLGGAAISVPFQFLKSGSRVMVDVEVNGKSMPMIFDTGNTASACSFMSEGQAEKAGVKIPPDAANQTHTGVNGSGNCKVFPIRRLKLGPIERTDVMVSVNTEIADDKGGLEAPLLGQPFWENYEYTIDMQRKMIHFIRR